MRMTSMENQEHLKMTNRCKERFQEVYQAVERLTALCGKGKTVFVGIDGMCATGKTTLGYYLKEQFDCNLFHMYDFFLQGFQRTEERLTEIGGNVDYERFQSEVIEPLCRQEDVWYRPYDCRTGIISQGEKIVFKQLNIMEGSYSLHPYFGDIYDLRVFTESTSDRQLENIRKRNGEQMLIRFEKEWIPKENAYFEKFRIREGCIVVPWREDMQDDIT